MRSTCHALQVVAAEFEAICHSYASLDAHPFPLAPARSLAPYCLPQAPKLRSVWLEGNPLTPEAVAGLLQALPPSGVTALGLDRRQLAQAPPHLMLAAAAQLRQSSTVAGAADEGVRGGPGYFKLELSPLAAAAMSNGSGSSSNKSNNGSKASKASNGSDGRQHSSPSQVLVVSFGSAPGTPNWGGLLRKVRAAAETPQEQEFDVLYVVDPCRSWYEGEGRPGKPGRSHAACECAFCCCCCCCCCLVFRC